MPIDKELKRALEADGEKLKAMTGQDHGPVFLTEEEPPDAECPRCGGEGSDEMGFECETCDGYGYIED
jgi:hypothetical protein